jgi:hypothetical protein
LNRVADFVPAAVLGLIAIVATWQPTSVSLVAQIRRRFTAIQSSRPDTFERRQLQFPAFDLPD